MLIKALGENPKNVLREEDEVYNDPPEYGSATFYENGRAVVMINGKKVNEKQMKANTKKRYKRIDAHREIRIKKRRDKLNKLSNRNRLHRVSGFQKDIDNGSSSVILPIPKGKILEFVHKNMDIIAGIELYLGYKNEIDSAMEATNIKNWALNWPGNRGEGIGIYMSEEACPNPDDFSNYKKLSSNAADDYLHAVSVASILREVSPDSYIYCRSKRGDEDKRCWLPVALDLEGYDGNPRIHIENYSCGSNKLEDSYNGRDGSYHIHDRDFDNHVYNNGITIFASAGNWGNSPKPPVPVDTPGKALNIITVGNYDDSNNTIHPTSSYSNPNTGTQKPEIVAPGTDIYVSAFDWLSFTGTSQASPHAAAFAADILSKYKEWITGRPALIKAHMLAAATDFIIGGPDKVGLGGIDYLSNPWNPTAMKWWEGGNDSFSYFDSVDPYPNNGYIDYKVYINVGGGEHWDDIRIVLCWLSRGTYTYDHRNGNCPVGMNLGLFVYDPNGNSVGKSNSLANSYEVVDFTPTTEGYYTIKISRWRNYDTASKLHIGLVVNSY